MKSIPYMLALAVMASAAQAEPTTRIGASYYYIDGASALVLTGQMDSKGPEGADGRRHPAQTKWDVQWRFRHNMYGDVCKMEKVMVLVGLTSIKPRWRGESDGAPALRKRWQQLVQAIDEYEAYHKKQAQTAGEEIERAINNVKPEKTCEAMTESANRVAAETLEKFKSNSRDYDKRTDYGRKNGVSLM